MKVSKTEKLERQLEATESHLRSSLLSLLPKAMADGTNIFTNSEFNPSQLPQHLFFPAAEALLQSARESIQLREQLGLDVRQSVGGYFLEMCEENACQSEQRRGPRKLAESLLLNLNLSRA